MRLATLKGSLLLILVLTSALCSAYNFVNDDPFDLRRDALVLSDTTDTESVHYKKFWDSHLKSIKVYPPEQEERQVLDFLDKCIINDLINNTKKPVLIASDEPDVVETPEEVPLKQDFEGIAKTKETLPDIEDIEVEEPIKVIVHTTSTCGSCHSYVKEINKLKDKFNIVVENHAFSTYTKHGTWLTAFPVTEIVKGDKLLKAKVGFMSAEQLEGVLKSIK